jgi:menaquinone-specific isochorismate synthase
VSIAARSAQPTFVAPLVRRPLWARTTEIPDPGELSSLLPSASSALAWVRQGEGLIGWGQLAVVHTAGPSRFASAQAAWQRLLDGLEVHDEVRLPGTGAIAFTSFTFDASADRSVLIVPRYVVGRRGGRSWITELGTAATAPAFTPTPPGAVGGHPAQLGPDEFEPVRELGRPRWGPGLVSTTAYRSAVVAATGRMRAGRLDKVVLARDLLARFDSPVDARVVLARLARRHSECWSYAVDGLVGATPELLLRKRGGVVESRVLAGTTWPGGAAGALGSAKNQQEHRYAVDSLRATLRPFCTTLTADGPKHLPLRNVTHLSTDIRGVLAGRTAPSVLQLAASVHPTAAVGGTPSGLAAATIADIEGRLGLRRGRYAGPVGWVDAGGNGELGLALRCAQLSDRSARLFAGCGIVADSDPEVELAESTAKFRAVAEILDA